MLKWLQYLCFLCFFLFSINGATAGHVSRAGYELSTDGLWYRGGIGYERYLDTCTNQFGDQYACYRYRGVPESVNYNTPGWRSKLLQIVEQDRLDAARIEHEQNEAAAFQQALELLQPQGYDEYGQGQGDYGQGGYGGYAPTADQGPTVFGYHTNSYSMIAQLYDRSVPLVLAHSLAAAQSRSDKLSAKLADKQAGLLDTHADLLKIVSGPARPGTEPAPEPAPAPEPPKQPPQDEPLSGLEVIGSRCAEGHNSAKRSGKGSELFPDGLDLTKWEDYTLEEREFVIAVVDSGRMPPGHDPLTEAERRAFHLP